MYVSKIRMQNFRCYTDFTMQFSPKVTVIVAENGRGEDRDFRWPCHNDGAISGSFSRY